MFSPRLLNKNKTIGALCYFGHNLSDEYKHALIQYFTTVVSVKYIVLHKWTYVFSQMKLNHDPT